MLKEICIVRAIPTYTNHNDGLVKAWKRFKRMKCYDSNDTYITLFQYEDNKNMYWEFYRLK